MTENADIEAVVRALESGDQDALARLFGEYRQQLRRMVGIRLDRRLQGRIDASDVVQEAYIDAQTRIQHYLRDPSVPFYIWLRQVTGQTLIDLHRRHLGTKMRDARREVSFRQNVGPASSALLLAEHLVGHLPSPSQGAMQAEMVTQLTESLDRLEEVDREILALRHFEELTNGQAAEVLGLKPAAASIRYIRALRRLKAVMPANSILQSASQNIRPRGDEESNP